jgi:predicted ester cyclase
MKKALVVLIVSFSLSASWSLVLGAEMATEGCPGVQPTQSSIDTEHNMAVVRCYFGQILDNQKFALADQVFTSDCIMHRPERQVTGVDNIKNFVSGISVMYSEFRTTVLDMFATGDRVAVRLKHDVTTYQDGVVLYRAGSLSAKGKKLSWTANSIFRFKEGKIVEEWVERDELGMLLQLGILITQP